MGWHGSGCDIAHLTLNAFASAASCVKLSYATIFVDTKAAYDITIHRMALPMSDADEWVRSSVAAMGFSAEEAADMAS